MSQRNSYAKREAFHAGSWYSNGAVTLENELQTWLSAAKEEQSEAIGARAIIAPHAGYSYSGPTAAFAYSSIEPEKVKRVFLLGPSHHFYLENCAITGAKEYATPIGNIPVDVELSEKLHETGLFSVMSKKVDEEEHSLEMHLPYIVHIMKHHAYKLVPVLVGNLDPKAEKKFGAVFAEYLSNESNLFVISSDFCHWGARFGFQHYNKEDGEIYQSIEKLDRMGMTLIEKLDFDGFITYLRKYKNTICGRHPIGVLLAAINQCNSVKFDLKFVKYAQSSQCRSATGSSVSYASAIAVPR